MDDTGKNTGSLACRIQMSGILHKRPIGHEATKWSRRFFIIKDGFLFYYPDSAQKTLEKRQSINLHPKGILPLGGCSVEPVAEPGHSHCLAITTEETSVKVFMSAENELERDRWITAIQEASRITWRNAQLGDAMIQQLERQGLQVAKEKQECLERLQEQTEQARSNQLRVEELEAVNKRLEEEKQEIHKLSLDLQKEYERIEEELETKGNEVRAMAEEQESLSRATVSLHRALEKLAEDKSKITAELKEQQTNAAQLSRDKDSLSVETDALTNKLTSIEAEMSSLTEQKTKAEKSLKDHQTKSLELEQEKCKITKHAKELQESLKELASQKAMTDAELKEEIQARMLAERRLREAEESLARIESRLQQTSIERPEKVKEMMADVKTLKRYFENIAFESKLDANKVTMIKRSLEARKRTVRQAKTVLLDRNTKSQFRELLMHPQDGCLSDNSPTSPSSLLELPTSPAASSEEQFSTSARVALTVPGVRHSCLAALQQLDQLLPSNN